ncbi:MAG: hypothetical protein PHI38_09865 [Sulfurimonas sp.]|jgi:cell division protein FtsL|nr:hypothetical protein [Sulfurimonas sp.]MDD3477162.1 hypothetical protein [Sulfurimonas sp.]HUH42556.1 hypothetical protein [Sulfurimonas sp.]
MSTVDKIKKIVLIVLGLSLSAYLIYNGFKILNQEEEIAPKSIESK